jgi:hypothetical protein
MQSEIERTIREHLEPDERLLWSGRAVNGFGFTVSDILRLPSLVLFFVMFTIIRREVDPPLLFFVFLGIVWSGALAILIGEPLSRPFRRRRTTYGVTSKRALIVTRYRTTRVKSIPLDPGASHTLSERAGGRGSIAFGVEGAGSPVPSDLERNKPDSFKDAIAMQSPRRKFEDIANVRQVYAFIREAQASRATPGYPASEFGSGRGDAHERR